MNGPSNVEFTNAGQVLIAIWPYSHDPLDAAIKALTRGYGTHAGFVRSNGRIIENFVPHVRERDFLPGEHLKVELYRLDGMTPADDARLERYFDEQLRNPPAYSIADLFRYAFDLPPRPGNACFCSQWVLRCLRLNLAPSKQPLVRLEYQDFASPRDLRLSPRLKPAYLPHVAR
jgi:hypothetical protein